MSSTAPATGSISDQRTLKRELQQYYHEYAQLQASMRKCSREHAAMLVQLDTCSREYARLDAAMHKCSRQHAALMERMPQSIPDAPTSTAISKASGILSCLGAWLATGRSAAGWLLGAARSLAPSRDRTPFAASRIRPARLPQPQSPLCNAPDELLELVADAAESGVVWQTCSLLRQHRLLSIEAVVLGGSGRQALAVPTGGSYEGALLRLYHQLTAARKLVTRLRGVVADAAAAADSPSRYNNTAWSQRFRALGTCFNGRDGQELQDAPVAGLKSMMTEVFLGQGRPHSRETIADQLIALPQAISLILGQDLPNGCKQTFLTELREHIRATIRGLRKPHDVRLLAQAAPCLVDPFLEECTHNTGCSIYPPIDKALDFCQSMQFKGYRLTLHQKRACRRLIDSSTCSEKTRKLASETLEKDTKNDTAGGTLDVPFIFLCVLVSILLVAILNLSILHVRARRAFA